MAHLERLTQQSVYLRFNGRSKATIVLLFTGQNGDLYGYEDRFQADGMFWYTGEGQVGDMKFVRANRALRDHEAEGRRVYLFEQTRKSYVRFVAEVHRASNGAPSCRNGYSPTLIFRYYREMVTPDQAQEWFSIRPKVDAL